MKRWGYVFLDVCRIIVRTNTATCKTSALMHCILMMIITVLTEVSYWNKQYLCKVWVPFESISIADLWVRHLHVYTVV